MQRGEGDALAVEAVLPERRAAEGRRLRVGAWSGFLLVAAVYYGAHALPMSPRASLVLNQLAFLAPIALSVAGGAVAYARSRSAERRFWLLLTSANAILLASEAYYSAYMIFVNVRGPQSPSPFEYLNLTSAVLFFGLLMSMTRLGTVSLVARIRFAADTMGCVLVGVAAAYGFVVAPLFAENHVTNPATRLLGAVYPVIGLIMLGGTLSNIIGFKVSKWEPWEKLAAWAIGVFSIGLVMWPLAAVSNTPGTQASIFDLAYLAGEYLLVMATVARLTRPSPSRLRPLPAPLGLARPAAGAAGLVLPASMMLAVPYLVSRAYSAGTDSLGYAVFGVSATALAGLLVSRTALTAVENGRLFERSVTDPLTGLFNHSHFHEQLASDLELAGRYGETVSVAVVDLDDFARVNKVHGHASGDAVLRRMAERVRSAVRESDTVCRIGGDRFGVILPEANVTLAREVCERVLDAIRQPAEGLEGPVTASIGLASCPRHGEEKEDLLRKADGAQYWAKCHGKDHVMLFDPAIVDSLDANERIKRLEERTHLDTVRALAAVVDARDPLTQDHSRNVAKHAVALGREIGLDDDRVKLLEMAALLHDIGKIGISDDVLRKWGELTAEERRHVEQHPVLGRRILASTTLTEILPWTLAHHERWDGAGYPDGLAGEDIPLEARILALTDAFDAMTSGRPYRTPMDAMEALHEIDLSAGTQFDPALADTFIAMMKREGASF